MLAEWRTTRDPALEPLIERIGTRIARTQERLAGPKAAIEIAWHAVAVAGVPTDVERLLETPWPATWRLVLARVNALAKLPQHPRIALAVARAAINFGSRSSAPLHRAVSALLVASATAALRPLLNALAGLDPMLARLYDPVTAAIDQRERHAADPHLVVQARDLLAGEADPSTLYAELARDPSNLGLRAVLADALQEVGDPRGEFIALQLRGGPKKRIAELLDRHGDAWIGPLPGVRAHRFERGFLSHLDVEAPAAVLAQAVDRVEWTTLESLTLATSRFDPSPLVRRMPLLRDLVLRDDEALERLEDGGPFPSLRRLGCTRIWTPSRADAFPNLAVFAVIWTPITMSEFETVRYEDFLAACTMPALSFMQFPARWLEYTLRRRDIGPPVLYFQLDTALSFDPPGFRLKVTRDLRAAELAYQGQPGFDHLRKLEDILAALFRARIAQVTIHTEHEARWSQTVAQFDLDVRWVDEPLPIE